MKITHSRKLAHSIAQMSGIDINSIVNELKAFYNSDEICQEIINISNIIEIDVNSANLLLKILYSSLPSLPNYLNNLTVFNFIENGYILGVDFSFHSNGDLLLTQNLAEWLLNN